MTAGFNTRSRRIVVPENKSGINNGKIASDVNISHVRGGKTMIYDPTENILLSRNEETCGHTLGENVLKTAFSLQHNPV